MGLFGATEYLVLGIGADQTLRGVRVRKKKHLELISSVVLPPDGRALTERLSEAGSRLNRRRDQILILAPALTGSVFFRTISPEMGKKELIGAMEFEVPQHLFRQNVPVKTTFRAIPAGNNQLNVSVWAAPEEELRNIFLALESLHWKADAVLSPFLALPAAMPADEEVYFGEFEPAFYWSSGSFHPASSRKETAGAWIYESLKKSYHLTVEQQNDLPQTAPLLLLAQLAAAPDFAGKDQHFDIVPKNLHPKRLRSQLRTMTVLAGLFVLLWGINSYDNFIEYYRAHSALAQENADVQAKTKALQRKLSGKNREIKEMNRIMDMNLDQHDYVERIGQLSAVLPNGVLVNNLRVADDTIDMTLSTATENLDLAQPLRSIPKFKVGTLQNRKVNDTLFTITLKLNREEEGKKKK